MIEGKDNFSKHYNLKPGELEEFEGDFQKIIQKFFQRMKESQKPCENVRELEKKIVTLETENKKLLEIIDLAKIGETSGEKKLKIFEEKLGIKKEGNGENLKSLKIRWKKALEFFEEKHPNAFAFLNFCSFFNSKKIPKKWAFEWIKMEKKGGCRDYMPLLEVLKEFDIIKYDFYSSTFSLNKYMQKMVQKEMKNKGEIYKKAFSFVVSQIKDFRNIFSNFTKIDKENCSHLKYMLENDLFKTEKPEDIDLLKAYNAIQFFKMSNQTERALEYCEKIYEIAKNLKNLKEREKGGLFFILHKIGENYSVMQVYELALQIFLKTFEASKEIYGEGANQYTFSCLKNIVKCFEKLGKKEEGKEYFKQKVEMEKELTPFSFKIVRGGEVFSKNSTGIVNRFFLSDLNFSLKI
jgi:hypothetical protein